MPANTNTVIIIVGPTASGKTALSLQLAQHFNTSIISADSRQCFKELNIGVAKPTAEELAAVKHYFINSHSIHEAVNAHDFEQYALQAVGEIFKEKPIAIMVGGTGLYIKAFCEGLDAMPEASVEIRTRITEQYQLNGLTWLQQEVQMHDPLFWAVAEQQNPRRLMRALEIYHITGKSFTEFKTQEKKVRPFRIIKLGIDVPKASLRNNINTRVDAMVADGLVAEASSLLPYQQLNALQTVGYKELFDHFNRNRSYAEAIEAIKTNTARYAKRQLTWFRKDTGIHWQSSGIFSLHLNALHESGIK